VKKRGPRPFRYNVPMEIESERMPRTWAERLF
jgi:hypothetical protein